MTSDTFTPRQAQALLAIAETLVPGGDGAPAPRDLDYMATVTRTAEHKLLPGELREMKIFLDLWDTPGMGMVHGIGPRRFSAVSPAEREAALLRWGSSSVGAKRSIFQGLRSLLIGAYYIAPDATAVRAAIGYPEAFGPLPDAPPRPITPLVVPPGGAALTADVVIVGSGAGGGTAAAVLTAAGLDVVVLEKGGYHDDRDFGAGELEALTSLYAGPPAATKEGQLSLMAGGTLGGGTVVNWTTSFPTPDHVRAEWAGLGATQFAGEEYDRALAAVQQRLSVNTDHDRIAHRDAVMERGLRALGWHCDAMPRNVVGCDQGVECGRCGYGCRIGAKQSTAKTWLQDAADGGARIVVGADVRRVRVERGRATGVEAVMSDGAPLIVAAKAVVVAAGTLQTPALLRRSGLRNKQIGANLRLHPATAVAGRFDEDIRPWEGGLQTRYSTEHADLDGRGYGVIYETGPMHPGAAAIFQPWHSAEQLAEEMRALRNLGVVGVITRDTGSGRVAVGRNGEPVAHYRINDHDAAHMHRGIVGAAQILAAAGASSVRSAHQVRVAATLPGPLDGFAAAAQEQGYAPGRCLMAALHIMGTAAMGGSPKTSATDPDGATWEVPNLVVADASCFPTPSGVNPMISVEAIAYMNACRLAARMT
ncbi:Glucose-methanol-choline oxidoreductase OS=Tsukamurella paurometabola (strain ATCC 8368 / DSM/ CCUG 35730 / CIP 100753 / JCM 10117 / KCTC 9821 / NBRC 16120/ NCIMB 702349 / NCTC 13040) OX=521096 GN=Tpau_3053 PE=4 SV=1 [Tsukamurella paurometabola]|uniref:Glucose-methanol-choline oxidoreductase n=1 Tax=Tsukamurella paurometabola (strain ATCC 8368 / DSM 20162 / CCUG 35730 / CIP 100753 / JCM 10117 / KCTC 9821 / NBRC 16120 / NCIMB 702349 / NCTC 13040) TaxID=521096 RepID=D5UUS8_TSUPD|nr:GMC family oxidoreductase [Tsukamurella paurometabola]ADG79646.1 glucose-methanol-choline oxidoreductase [Tsukamurella paurometabola DSM 20162]SUP36588.1 choline dehydrogenase [Tsukamurella paurometabola]